MKNISIIILFLVITFISPLASANPLTPNEYGLFQLDLAMKQIMAVDNDMYLLLGWRYDEKDIWPEQVQGFLKELGELKNHIRSLELPEDLTELQKGYMLLIDERSDLYSGIELKEDDAISAGYANIREKAEKYGAIFQTLLQKHLSLEDLPEGFYIFNAELELIRNEEDRAAYREAVNLLENQGYIESYNALAALREKYRNTRIEGSILLKLAECLYAGMVEVQEYRAGGPYHGEHALDYLSEIMDSGKYYLILDKAFDDWMSGEQFMNHGASNWSDMPNKMYNQKRWEVVETINRHLEDHPNDAWAKWQILVIMSKPNITRGGAFGNSSLNHFATKYMDLKND